MDSEPIIRILVEPDIPSLVVAFERMQIALAGSSATAVHKAVAEQMAARRNALCPAAFVDGKLAGFVLTMIGPFFWRNLARRYPLAATHIALARGRRCLSQPNEVLETDGLAYPLDAHQPKYSWKSRDERLARVLFVGVLPEYRGRRIATYLYTNLLSSLRKTESITAILAHISPTNTESLGLHRRKGFTLTAGKHSVFAYRDLSTHD